MKDPITITEAAAAAIKAKTAQKPGAIGLRLGVKTTGCSGNSYVMEHVMQETPADDKFEGVGGAVLYIPKTNSWMLFGMEIDYTEDKMQSGFVFRNPNESGRCGCGESFSVNPTGD